MKIIKDLGHGHTIEVIPSNRGIKGEYFITYFEDGKALLPGEYVDVSYLREEFDIEL